MQRSVGSYSLEELSERAAVTPRTVRYYIQQGLLPPPNSTGPNARYGDEHLLRLQAIRQLQAEYLPLAEIRKRLDALDSRDLSSTGARGRGSGSAADYIRTVLTRRPPEPAALAAGPGTAPAPPTPLSRSQWERVVFSADIELHVRRPLARDDIRKLELLLAFAQRLFKKETP